MPTNESIRERIIRLVRPEDKIVRSHLLRKFNVSDRDRANEQVSLLLSEGVLVRTGLGVRGSPETIQRGKCWPKEKCPFCHQIIH